jgi:hypothetical protein
MKVDVEDPDYRFNTDAEAEWHGEQEKQRGARGEATPQTI